MGIRKYFEELLVDKLVSDEVVVNGPLEAESVSTEKAVIGGVESNVNWERIGDGWDGTDFVEVGDERVLEMDISEYNFDAYQLWVTARFGDNADMALTINSMYDEDTENYAFVQNDGTRTMDTDRAQLWTIDTSASGRGGCIVTLAEVDGRNNFISTIQPTFSSFFTRFGNYSTAIGVRSTIDLDTSIDLVNSTTDGQSFFEDDTSIQLFGGEINL